MLHPYGAIFERVEIRELAEKNRAQLLTQAKVRRRVVKWRRNYCRCR